MAETVELAGTRLLCPAHVCAFFSSQEAEDAVYLPFMQAGIEAGEKCVHILDAERRDEKRAKLRALGINIAAAEDTGHDHIIVYELCRAEHTMRRKLQLICPTTAPRLASYAVVISIEMRPVTGLAASCRGQAY
jgi:hypothetical protein